MEMIHLFRIINVIFRRHNEFQYSIIPLAYFASIIIFNFVPFQVFSDIFGITIDAICSSTDIGITTVLVNNEFSTCNTAVRHRTTNMPSSARINDDFDDVLISTNIVIKDIITEAYRIIKYRFFYDGFNFFDIDIISVHR